MQPTIHEVSQALGGCVAIDEDKAQWLIESATRELNARIPSLSSADAARLALAKDVIIKAVARVLRNPHAAAGYSSESEGAYTYSVRAQDATANIWFPNSDLALLTGAKRPAFGSMRIGTIQRRAT